MNDLLGCDLDALLERFASVEPAPGGGSAAALAGAVAAALACMAARIALKKPADEAAATELTELLQQACAARDRLTNLVQEDAAAFLRFVEARRLPKQTPEEQAARHAALDLAGRGMTLTPLTTSRTALEVLRLLERLAELGNPNTITDVGVAADLARAALEGGRLNVLVNLSAMPEGERGKLAAEVDALREDAAGPAGRVAERVGKQLGK